MKSLMACATLVLLGACASTPQQAADRAAAQARLAAALPTDKADFCTDSIVRYVPPKGPFLDSFRKPADGWIVLSYDLNGVGSATNIIVVDAEPREVFDRASIEAIRRSSYAPGVHRPGCKAHFTFTSY